jgi:hypothetical protein
LLDVGRRSVYRLCQQHGLAHCCQFGRLPTSPYPINHPRDTSSSYGLTCGDPSHLTLLCQECTT